MIAATKNSSVRVDRAATSTLPGHRRMGGARKKGTSECNLLSSWILMKCELKKLCAEPDLLFSCSFALRVPFDRSRKCLFVYIAQSPHLLSHWPCV